MDLVTAPTPATTTQSPVACYEPEVVAPSVVATIGTVEVTRAGPCLTWTSGMAVDSDGAPDAYSPPNSGLRGRDLLANAGRVGRWYGIVTANGSPDGTPVIQGPTDPCPGYYVSPTALADHSRAESDPRRYVDAGKVPYISIPPELHALGVRMGDVCEVHYRDQVCAAIVADSGPRTAIGEGSCALANALGIDPSPIHGGCGRGVTWRVWPGTSKGWPRLVEDINAQVAQLAAGV